MAFAFPDVCITPAAPSPVPVPYPNLGQFASANGTVDKVLVENMEVVAEGSRSRTRAATSPERTAG